MASSLGGVAGALARSSAKSPCSSTGWNCCRSLKKPLAPAPAPVPFPFPRLRKKLSRKSSIIRFWRVPLAPGRGAAAAAAAALGARAGATLGWGISAPKNPPTISNALCVNGQGGIE
jgi:hypothetical protein